MKLKNVVYKSGYTQDGTLKPNQGRIVIFASGIKFSCGNTPDHMYLLHALAASMKVDSDTVISNAIRLYYTLEDGVMIVSQNRKIDEEQLMENLGYYGNLIYKAWN